MNFPIEISQNDIGVSMSSNFMGAKITRSYDKMVKDEREWYRGLPDVTVELSFNDGLVGLNEAASIEGFISLFDLALLSFMSSGREVAIEIGSLYGRSTRVINGNVPVMFAVDTFNGEDDGSYGTNYEGLITQYCIREIFDEHARTFPNELHTIQDRSDNAIKQFLDKGYRGKVDFIFIDGDHSYEGAKSDVVNYLPLLADGGVMCGHDYQYEPLRRAVDEVLGDKVIPLCALKDDDFSRWLKWMDLKHEMWAYIKK